MGVLAPLPPEDASVHIVPMLTPTQAVDLYLGDLQRRGYSRRTIPSYRRLLDKFTDSLPRHFDVTDITPDDTRRWLDGWNHCSQGTKSNTYTVLHSFLEWLYRQDRLRRNPLDKVPRPKRIKPEDLDVTTVSGADVARLLAACEGWTERLAIGIAVYLGPRRAALSNLRLRDYDPDTGRLRFHEKGSKTIWKPIPYELEHTIRAAILAGAIVEQDDYLIPPEGPLVRPGDRDDRVIWRVVKRVAWKAGVETHVHALRAAFATFYLEQNIGDTEALQALMGHENPNTTRVYLRRLDRDVAMERVRGLSWDSFAEDSSDSRFASSVQVGAGGFEPPFMDDALVGRAGRQRRAHAHPERSEGAPK